jgi:hypothetical protein
MHGSQDLRGGVRRARRGQRALPVLATRVEGIVWQSTNTPATDNGWSDVVWVPAPFSRFVAVAPSTSAAPGFFAMTSPDGIAWTLRPTPADNVWEGVAYSPTLQRLAAVGSSGVGNRVMTSDDGGLTWTIRASPQDSSWTAVVWVPGFATFVAIAWAGVNRVMTSPDGIAWTLRVATSASAWFDLAVNADGSRVIAVRNDGATLMHSDDGGATWAAVAINNRQWQAVEWSAALGLWVVVGGSGAGDRVMTSPTGLVGTWTMRANPNDFDWRCLAVGAAGRLVAMSSTGLVRRIMTSPDGIVWTARVSPGDLAWRGLAYSSDLDAYVALCDGASHLAAYSPSVPPGW